MFEEVARVFREETPAVDFCSLRVSRERSQTVWTRQGVLQPVGNEDDFGAMVVVHHGGGTGYSATPDLSRSGIRAAIAKARAWAERTADMSVVDFSKIPMPHPTGTYESKNDRPWSGLALGDKIDLLNALSERLKTDDRIVDWESTLWWIDAESLYLTNGGGEVSQVQHILIPHLQVAANDGVDTVVRSLGGRGFARQGGLELLDGLDLSASADRIAREALMLLSAPSCPSETTELVLAPDQMMLQIHESIGHPLELDRILGDERNYAGTSFVTLDMFGSYQYGSELLNVTYDPTVDGQLASYAFDDEGVSAEREFIIREGKLERPLGSVISQHRANMPGVANSRANGWNRPSIDRMANLNVEPGEGDLDALISEIERGVYMETNVSWSIDDSRNKFQFGCEFARLIENGELTDVVKKPNYRGVSASFWRNLSGVGGEETRSVLGTPYCGKGEPNQVIRVGHASPTCRFSDVEVFGGA